MNLFQITYGVVAPLGQEVSVEMVTLVAKELLRERLAREEV